MKKYQLGFLLAMFSTTAFAALPYSFTTGGTISAAQINANFSYLESMATARPSPTTYQRYSNSFVADGTSNPVFTATQNLIIRDIFIMNGNSCVLAIGSNALPFSGGVSLTNIAVPVLAGEAVSISCTFNSATAVSMVVVSQ